MKMSSLDFFGFSGSQSGRGCVYMSPCGIFEHLGTTKTLFRTIGNSLTKRMPMNTFSFVDFYESWARVFFGPDNQLPCPFDVM